MFRNITPPETNDDLSVMKYVWSLLRELIKRLKFDDNDDYEPLRNIDYSLKQSLVDFNDTVNSQNSPDPLTLNDISLINLTLYNLDYLTVEEDNNHINSYPYLNEEQREILLEIIDKLQDY